ncbi:MAG: B12-binding domain-containing radical SAM protein [Candidatus Sumerlaeia bacterium]
MKNNDKGTVSFLFLNPPDPDGGIWMKEVGRCGRKAIGGEIWPQTGLAYLAAMVEREGGRCRIIDGMAKTMSIDVLVHECRDWKPDVIIANSATPTLKNDSLVLHELVQATGALPVFAGPHVSALPESTLSETCAEVGLVNEAEETVAEVYRLIAEKPEAFQDRSEAFYESLGEIRGIVWKKGEKIVLNPPRPMIEDLDSLPLPARHLLPMQKYHMPFFQKHAFATIIPSRGCPWPCTFCRAGRVWGRKIRSRSVQSIINEINELREIFSIRHLVFMTDSLTLDRNWAKELFQAIMDLPEKPEWICNSRVDVVSPDMLALMKQANCQMISYGLESGSQEVLKRCRKGITLEQSARAIELTREAGLLSMAYFIIGLPGETRKSVQDTIRFAKKIRPDYVNFHVATPFPGTELYEEAVQKGWLCSDRWEDFEEEGSAVMQAGELTPEELEAWQAKAMRSFYMRPGRMLQELATLRSWSEFTAKARAGIKMLTTLGSRK